MTALCHTSALGLKHLMLMVILGLVPGTALYALHYGAVVWLQIGWCVLLVLGLECLMLFLRGQPLRRGLADLSWLVCALILARALPLLTSLWLIALACFAAVVLCKHGCGGLGRNRLNPAMVGLGIIAVCFHQHLYPAPDPVAPWTTLLSITEVLEQQLQLAPRLHLDATTGATPLSQNQLALWAQDYAWLGYLAGGMLLAARGVIRIEIPLAMVLSSVTLCTLSGHTLMESLHSLSLGGYLFTAVFIATDPVTSPDTRFGRVLFGVAVGTLTELIREFGLYVDGLCFAILAANLLTPQLDWLARRRFQLKQQQPST